MDSKSVAGWGITNAALCYVFRRQESVVFALDVHDLPVQSVGEVLTRIQTETPFECTWHLRGGRSILVAEWSMRSAKDRLTLHQKIHVVLGIVSVLGILDFWHIVR